MLKTAENEEQFSNVGVPAHLWWLPLDLRAGFNHLLGDSPAGRTIPTRQLQILSVHILEQQHNGTSCRIRLMFDNKTSGMMSEIVLRVICSASSHCWAFCDAAWCGTTLGPSVLLCKCGQSICCRLISMFKEMLLLLKEFLHLWTAKALYSQLFQ